MARHSSSERQIKWREGSMYLYVLCLLYKLKLAATCLSRPILASFYNLKKNIYYRQKSGLGQARKLESSFFGSKTLGLPVMVSCYALILEFFSDNTPSTQAGYILHLNTSGFSNTHTHSYSEL